MGNGSNLDAFYHTDVRTMKPSWSTKRTDNGAADHTVTSAQPGRPKLLINHFQLTEHARCRASQRGLKLADIRYTLQFGHCYYVGDAFIYYLRRVDIPNADYPRMKRLEGTAVIAAREEACIITVWRNRKNGLRNIRRKLAQIWRKEREVMGDE